MKKKTLKIELTPEQKEQIRKATGKEVTELKLAPEALEARIAPGIGSTN
jgi:hypothetical protein